MNKKEIWRMAVEAGLGEPVNHDRWDADLPRLERFATLVAEHEREACAKVCEDKNTLLAWATYAQAIRARGQA